MKPQLGGAATLLVAVAVTISVSPGAGFLATLPLSASAPFSTRAALFMFTACLALMVGVSASEPFMRRAAQRRARKARQR
ncbi:hypothetical protein [Kitasatospora sp. NPDC001175]|uniref:hypothetical protein n=1 Tax=Kitasatospora sp. NPDC001175 TaxID=3157103 RepID=UPI003D0310C7